MEKQNPSACFDQKDWVLRIIDSMEQKIAKKVDDQAPEIKQLNDAHRQVKSDIIKNRGIEKWKKFNGFDWKKLSPEAKYRLVKCKQQKQLNNALNYIKYTKGKNKTNWTFKPPKKDFSFNAESQLLMIKHGLFYKKP